jgi:hypothetical protein
MTAKIPDKPSKTTKPSKDTVYVDVDDEITTIIDKVEAAKTNIVALVLPKRAATLQSIVNMRLLKRSADAADKNVVLITSEAAILPLAGAAGLHAAKNLQSKPIIPASPVDKPNDKAGEDEQVDNDEENETEEPEPSDKIDYAKPVGVLAAAGAVANADEDAAIDLDDEDDSDTKDKDKTKADKKAAKPAKDKKLKVPNFDKFRLWIVLGAVLFAGLIVFLIFAIFVMPKAKITIKTSSVPVSADLQLTTSSGAKTLDTEKGVIPAVLKTTDQKATQTVNATGQQNNGTKASGSVALSNCTSSSVKIPAGTGISANGLTYITQDAVSLSDGNFTGGGVCKTSGSHVGSVDVVSQGAGAKFNGSHGPYTVAGFSGVSATDSGGMSGGSDNIITILSQSDVDGAKSKITSADTDKFTKAFEGQLAKEGNYVLVSTLKPSDPVVTSTPTVGQPASSATVNIKITYTVLVVSKTDLSNAINEKLAKQVDKDKQKLSTDDVLKTATVVVQNQTSPTAATLNISEDTTAVPIIDVDGIKQQVAGQKTNAIKTTISGIPGVKEVEVKLSPFWVSKAPKKASKIVIVQDQVKN